MVKQETKTNKHNFHVVSLIITGILTVVLGYNFNAKLSGESSLMSVESWGLLTGIGLITFACGLLGMLFLNKEQIIFYGLSITASCVTLIGIAVPHFVDVMKTSNQIETLATFSLTIIGLSAYGLITVVGILKLFQIFNILFPKNTDS